MRRFEKITSIIPALEDEGKHGEWIVDAEHRGASDDPVQMPFVGYGRAGEMLIEAVHECCVPSSRFEPAASLFSEPLRHDS